MSYAMTLKKESVFSSSFLVSLLQVLGGSLFIALCAQIAIPTPFSPVPITGHTFAVLMVGCTLGSRKGALSVLAYLAEVCMGLPVLSAATIAPWALLGPRGGYLIGMVAQAYLAGYVKERMLSSSRAVAVLLLACAVQLTLGVCMMANFMCFTQAFLVGMLPFIPGEILKSLVVASTKRI
ncbi:MAG: biotin transporter BioY [Parachlamydiaceae bacterium]|nr:biotin transporter BioY [Parachlamydiaceae bacterium]